MTSGRGRVVKFLGVGSSPEETNKRIQDALDQLAALPAENNPDIPVREKAPVRHMVRVSVEEDQRLDEGKRFLRCTTKGVPKTSGPVDYEFLRNGLNIASFPKLRIGAQFLQMATGNNAGAGIALTLSCNVFKAVVYDIPWGGENVPRKFSGPMAAVDAKGGHCELGDVEKNSAAAPGTNAMIATTDEWGNPMGHSGTLTWLGSNAVEQLDDLESSGLQWTATPFFFYDGTEDECLKFLQGHFGGGASGSGAESLTATHAKRCMTTSSRFPALLVARRVFVSAARGTVNGGWATLNSLDTSDTERAKWSVKLKGHQRVTVE